MKTADATRPLLRRALLRRALCAALLAGLPLAACRCEDEPLEEVTGGAGGTICNPVTGQPAPGVRVWMSFVSDDGFDNVREDTTDELGMFDIRNVPEGAHTFTAEADLFTETFDLEVVAHTPAVYADPGCRELALPAGTGEIAGQICNRHVGQFVSGATVSVILADGSRLETTSDADGNFSLAEVPEGVHVVYVQADGYSRTHQVEVEAGQQTLLEDQQRACSPPDPTTTGKVVGRICLQDGSDAGLGGVHVRLVEEIDGALFDDETLDDGTFLITGIPAPRTVSVRAEKGDFYYQWDDVEVFPIIERPDGTDLVQDPSGCVPLVPNQPRYLVIDGIYDKIQNVLERMGVADVTVVTGNPLDPTELWASAAFGNLAELSEFDAVFINCGVSELEFVGAPDPLVAQNLRTYVQQGGSLYVSDQAYDLIELVWPEKVDFLFADNERSSAEFGVDGSYLMEVAEPGLVDFLGQDELTIDFNFGYFALIQQVAEGTTVYLRSDIPYYVNDTTQVLEAVPVTVGFTDGAPGVGGKVIFTSFHQENDAVTGEPEELDGPEDAVLRYLIFEL